MDYRLQHHYIPVDLGSCLINFYFIRCKINSFLLVSHSHIVVFTTFKSSIYYGYKVAVSIVIKKDWPSKKDLSR
jgi:hypothetical protein